MRPVVVGAGAVGGSVGGLLAHQGIEVLFVARGAHGRHLQEHGLTLKLPETTLQLKIPTATDLEDVAWRPEDLVLLSTKLQDLPPVLEKLRSTAGAEIPVSCLTNGVHGERWAQEQFHTVLSTLVWLPSTHLAPGTVLLHTGMVRGVLDTGPIQGKHAAPYAAALCARFRQAGFEASPRVEIRRWKAAKWITNLGNTAQALALEDWETLAQEAQAEGIRILHSAGWDPIAPATLLARCAAVQLLEIEGKARQGGSTWQSKQRGVSLETPWIEGAMVALADSLNLAAPANRRLVELSAAASA